MTIVHINVPYSILLHRIDFAIENRIHPEIYFCSDDLDALQEKEVKDLAETLHREMDEHLPMGEGGFDFDGFFNLLSKFRMRRKPDPYTDVISKKPGKRRSLFEAWISV